MRNKCFGFCALLLLILPLLAVGQDSVLRLIPYNGAENSFLSAQIVADTTANNGIPANRVYELQRGALYLSKALFQVKKKLSQSKKRVLR